MPTQDEHNFSDKLETGEEYYLRRTVGGKWQFVSYDWSWLVGEIGKAHFLNTKTIYAEKVGWCGLEFEDPAQATEFLIEQIRTGKVPSRANPFSIQAPE